MASHSYWTWICEGRGNTQIEACFRHYFAFRLLALQSAGGGENIFGRARVRLCATCLQIATAVVAVRTWVKDWYVPQYVAVLRRLYEGTGGTAEKEFLGG